jgi:ribosome-associated protein
LQKNNVAVKPVGLEAEKLNALIVDAIQDIKGKNIVLLDLRHLHDAPTDFFIICEGDSNVQVRSIGDNIRKRLKEEMDLSPSHIEGQLNSLWVLVDLFTVVVHIFYRETRAFYELEDLWSDAIFTEYKNI